MGVETLKGEGDGVTLPLRDQQNKNVLSKGLRRERCSEKLRKFYNTQPMGIRKERWRVTVSLLGRWWKNQALLRLLKRGQKYAGGD